MNTLLSTGHAGDWTLDPPHAKRVCYHYTTCPQKNCIVRLHTQYRKQTIDLMYRLVRKKKERNKT